MTRAPLRDIGAASAGSAKRHPPFGVLYAVALTVFSTLPISAQQVEEVTRWTAHSVGGSTQAVLDRNGRVFITGTSTARTEVAVHDLESGLRLGTVGTRGRGPGEFMKIVGLATRGDSLAVLDADNQRISIFGPDLGLLETVRCPWTFGGGVSVGMPEGFSSVDTFGIVRMGWSAISGV